MTIRPILRYPHPGLKTVCTPVTAFDDDLKTLAGDLLETMRAAPGVGITAAHIGVFKRLFVLELSKADGVRNYVNPEIISSSPTLARQTEGSVSMPGATEDVERPASIRLRYQTLSGEKRMRTVSSQSASSTRSTSSMASSGSSACRS